MPTIYVDSTATVPAVASGDTVIFSKGGVAAVNNIDHSALAAGIEELHVNRDWTADIGTNTSPFKADIDVSATSKLRYAAGGGAMWYEPSGVNDVATLVRNLGFGTLSIVSSGTVTTLECGGGRTILGAPVAATTIRVARTGQLEVQGLAGTAPTTVHVAGGTYRTARGATTLNLYEGKCIVDAGSNAITTLNMYGGSLDLLQSGTITTFNLFAGDASNIKISRAITITTLNIFMSVANSDAFLNTPMLTITTTNKFIDASGNF